MRYGSGRGSRRGREGAGCAKASFNDFFNNIALMQTFALGGYSVRHVPGGIGFRVPLGRTTRKHDELLRITVPVHP